MAPCQALSYIAFTVTQRGILIVYSAMQTNYTAALTCVSVCAIAMRHGSHARTRVNRANIAGNMALNLNAVTLVQTHSPTVCHSHDHGIAEADRHTQVLL